MKKFATMAIVVGLSTNFAYANNDGGLYAFGNAGVNLSKIKSSNTDTNAQTTIATKATSGIWESGAGYKFNNYSALELSYANFGKISSTLKSFDASGKPFTLEKSSNLSAIRLAVIGSYPVSNNVNLYGKASFNRMRINEDNNNANKLRLGIGAGAEFQLNTNVSFRSEYEHINNTSLRWEKAAQTPMKNVNMVKAGLIYKF